MLNKTRKGMPTVTIVVGLVSTILVGSAILGSLQAIKSTSLDPNVDRTQTEIDQVGDTTVTIAASDTEMARQQMQGAIVWNMLAASDCRILTTFNSISQAKQGQDLEDDIDFDPDEMPAEPVEDRVFKTSSRGFLDELSQNKGNGYTGNFGDFMPLVNSGFDTPCVGTQSTIKQVEDAASEAGSDAVGGLFSVATKAVGGGLVLAGAGACVLTAGGACVAVAAGAGLYMSSGVAGDLAGEVIVPGGADDIGAEPGFDMEGVFSRMEFETKNTFLMGTDDRKEPFLGLALKFGDDSKTNTPGFWRGRRFSYLVPAGLNPDTFNQNEYHRIYDPGGYTAEGEYYYEDTADYSSGVTTGSGATRADARGEPEGESKLSAKHFWNGEGVDAPGTNQERNKMMFYAFRPRMENVPILAGEEITENDLTEGCDTDDCERDVIRLANFLEHTSYLFCEGVSGQIQSNAGHIYSSDEATSQEGPVEDQVYPKVEMEEGAMDCMPKMTLSVPDNVDLDCDPKALIEGASDEIFSRQTVNHGTHTKDVVCGTDGSAEGANLGGYGYQNYYVTEQAMTDEGCSADWYDITTDADVGGETLQEEDYPIVLGNGENSLWSHNYDTDYNDGDGYSETGGNGENNRITYERISANYKLSEAENLTYRISFEGRNSGRVTDGMLSSRTVNRTIIVEEAPSLSKLVVREIVEEPGSDDRLLSQAETFDQEFSGQTRNVMVDRADEGSVMINGVDLIDTGAFPNQIAVKNIEISLVKDATQYNQNYDWASAGVGDLNATQANMELQRVESYSEPRVCKGERGIWLSHGKDVIGD